MARERTLQMNHSIYPDDFEAKVGFDSLRHALHSLCISRMGRDNVDAMCFLTDYAYIKRLLNETAEMKSALESSLDVPAPVLHDISAHLSAVAAEGSYLAGEVLLRLLAMLESMGEVRKFYCYSDKETGSERFPALAAVFGPLSDFPEVAAEISRTIDRFGEVRDNASEELYAVRKAIRAAGGAVSRAVRRIMEKAIADGIVEKDAAPSFRDGRMVIPVAAGLKRSINGIVHDESASGKTVFIEPAEAVEISNRLRELQMEERREVIAVLTRLTAVIRPEIPAIQSCISILGMLDFITAKARYAITTGGVLPTVENTTEIDWFGAVHPQLLLSLRAQKREIVPLNINLNKSQRFIIISGPNAGGKSVVLKTVGLVQYMMQCGMLPTLYDNSHMGLFNKIFVDIGDQQSIENDLSTYSSHLGNMKYFLLHADAHTLLLADEMGSGTEPQIGGALGQAILASLSGKKCFGVVTTHYQNLKTFADSEEGFVNGAMLYDRQHLRPTFRLAVGNPGSSFALEIARNIGLPRDVIEDAKEIVGRDYVNLDKYLLDIERDRRYWSNKRQSVKEKEGKLNALLEKYEDTSADLKLRRADIINDARREAKEILATANARIEATIKAIRDAQAEKERTKEIRKNLEDFKKQVEQDESDSKAAQLIKPLRHKARKKPEDKAKSQKVSVSTKPLEAGDYVKMTDGGTVGKILSIQGKKAEVAFGSLRTFVETNRLRHAAAPNASIGLQQESVSRQTVDDSRRRQLNFRNEIDVRGMRADEALQAVDYFIDDAVQFNAGRVRILHGTGYGILRHVLRQHLQSNPLIQSVEDEDVRFGGAGITVVTFK